MAASSHATSLSCGKPVKLTSPHRLHGLGAILSEIGLAVLVGLFTASGMRRKSAEGCSGAFAWPMAASRRCAPVINPWYMLWLVPTMRSDLYGAHDDLDFGHNSYLSYLAFAHSRRPWVVPDGTMMLGYLSVAVTAAILALRRITGSVALQCMTDQVE